VVEIHQRDIDVFQQAVVRPTVDFPRLELVMVVTNFDPLEDVPELLVPEAAPVTDEDVNPLDAEAPLDGPVDSAGETPTEEAAPAQAAPAEETENEQ
jgi:hypothetical protein